jgi:hypothetical protein
VYKLKKKEEQLPQKKYRELIHGITIKSLKAVDSLVQHLHYANVHRVFLFLSIHHPIGEGGGGLF